MEEERRRIPCRADVEPQDHLDGLLLERAERTLGVTLQIECRVPLEDLAGYPSLAPFARRQSRGSSVQSLRPTRNERFP